MTASLTRIGCLVMALCACSCGTVRRLLPGQKSEPTTSAPTQPTQQGWALMYPELTAGGAAPTQPGGGPAPAVDSQGGTPTSAQGGLYDFTSMVQSAGQSNPGGLSWQQSAADAIELSKKSGKPLLTLFAHRTSQTSQAMENTMIRTTEFKSIVENFELLRLDYGDQDTRSSEYYRDFKKRLKAGGYPSLVLTMPDGEVVLRLSGFKTEYQEDYLKRLQASLATVEKMTTERRKKMETQGYRLWKNKDGKPIFAKLTALDANKATFVGEWGEEFKSFTNRLSEEDQAWIESKRQAAAASASS